MNVAFESEIFAEDLRTQQPFDVFPLLGDLNEELCPHHHRHHDNPGTIDVDAGPGLIEIISDRPRPLGEAVEAQQYLARMLDRCRTMPKDVRLHATMAAPWLYRVDAGVWNPKPRYRAMREAVRKESAHGRLIDYMSVRASTHINVRLDPLSSEGLLVLSLLNNIGPYLVDHLGKRYGLQTRGLLGLWQLFARPERFSRAGRWFASAETLEEDLSGIPRLIERVDAKRDEWRVDLDPENPTGLHDPASLGCVWWDERPKVNGHDERYTEIRLAPPMDPTSEAFEGYARDMLTVVGEICDITPAVLPECQEEGLPLLRKLHCQFPDILPERFLTEEEWRTTPSKLAPAWYPVPRRSCVAA